MVTLEISLMGQCFEIDLSADLNIMDIREKILKSASEAKNFYILILDTNLIIILITYRYTSVKNNLLNTIRYIPDNSNILSDYS